MLCILFTAPITVCFLVRTTIQLYLDTEDVAKPEITNPKSNNSYEAMI